MSEDSAGRTPNNRDLDPTGEVGTAMGTTPDCPSAEGSEDMSVTNSEVDSHESSELQGCPTRPQVLRRGIQYLQLG